MFRILSAAAAAAALCATAQPAQADWRGHYNYGYGHTWSAPSWWSQRDRPGDYRCDAYWDANRTDCHERWRDQRPYARNVGYGRHGYGYGYGGRYDYARYAHRSGVWSGAYGRPDLVYPAAGGAYAGGRDPGRVRWCARNYRSYNPATGYYRAYSGRYVFCG